ncbi:S8 family serine peptidase [Chlorobium sp. N1]|uniref:S8 family serine peptidase n=1 Tax=Chlorobium sp. N1 TaxID=2491138 RepID=UPI00104063C1|nr:S8 family serine peptidase [Chlorobium sp. N1]TCD48610.1 peptidase S8 [Chlorobium sp. N1]
MKKNASPITSQLHSTQQLAGKQLITAIGKDAELHSRHGMHDFESDYDYLEPLSRTTDSVTHGPRAVDPDDTPGGADRRVDRIAPEVVSFSPADGSQNVALDANIVFTFSETVTAGSGLIELHSASATGDVLYTFDIATSGAISITGNVLTIDPAFSLDAGTHFYVTIGEGAITDLADNSYAGTSTYDFTTVAATDVVAPTLTGFSPSDGSFDVDPDADILITFSEAVTAGSGLIELHDGSATGEVLYSFDVADSSEITFSDNLLVIDPTFSLDGGTHFYVTIGAGAVTDLAGNSFAGTDAYDFTTSVPEATWDPVSGYGLVNVDAALELATGLEIADADLYGDGYGVWDWGLNLIEAPDAWAAGYTGEGIVVAVIDTGVNYFHPDLYDNIWINTLEIEGNGIDDDGNGFVDDVYGYDFVNDDGYAFDDNGHGSHVSGIIAGMYDDIGVTGVAYDASIMAVKVLDSDGSGTFLDVASGIYYAVDNGADVINLSLGAYGVISSDLALALNYAFDSGVIVSMAAGNDYLSSPTYPATLAETDGGIAVGAIDSTETVAAFSNDAGTTEPYDYVVAPGVSIYSTYLEDSYAIMSGTSMATPYVSGVAALLLDAQSDFAADWTLDQLEEIIATSAQTLDSLIEAATEGTAAETGESADAATQTEANLDGVFASDDSPMAEISLDGITSFFDELPEVFIA